LATEITIYILRSLTGDEKCLKNTSELLFCKIRIEFFLENTGCFGSARGALSKLPAGVERDASKVHRNSHFTVLKSAPDF